MRATGSSSPSPTVMGIGDVSDLTGEQLERELLLLAGHLAAAESRFVTLVGVLVGLEIPLVMRILRDRLGFRELVANVLSFDYLGALGQDVVSTTPAPAPE